MESSELALLGGTPAVTVPSTDRWPIIEEEDIQAVVDLMRQGILAIPEGTGVIAEFESAFARYQGSKYALAQNNGTSTLHAAYFAVGVGPGTEVIVPTYTWPSTASAVLSANGIPVFCDIDARTFTVDPEDIERRITSSTVAIAVVHLWGHPAEMDEIAGIARRHDVALIEDCSHAHGATYKGCMVGTFGDIACYSLQSTKMLGAGEAGVVTTSNPDYFDRMLTLGHYGGNRVESQSITGKWLDYAFTGLGPKYRPHALAIAVANSQLKRMDKWIEMRTQNLHYLTEGLTGIPGIRPPYTAPHVTRGGWYGYRILYQPEELGGLPIDRFVAALQAEGVEAKRERYRLLHLEPLYQGTDIYGKGCPYRCPHVSIPCEGYHEGDFPVAEDVVPRLISLPTFTVQPCWELLDQYAAAFRKVAGHAEQLLGVDS